jgi:ABC-2 type transport system permease protein
MNPLLFPLHRTLGHRFLRQGQWRRSLAILFFGLALLGVIYLITARVVGYFHSQNELGVILSLKIMQMAWVINFTMLLFSTMISGVSAIFLSNDNEIMVAAPVTGRQLFAMRYLSTSVFTSWMMVVFSLPVFGAFGSVFHAGPLYWLLLLAAIVSTAATATGTGLTVTIFLVNLFPAKRTKDIVVYLSILFGVLLYLVIRLIKPEQLADPESFPDFIDYLSAISTPASPLLPPSWASNMMTLFLQEHRIDWLLLALLLLTPFVVYFFAELVMQHFFFPGFSKAQESFGGHRTFRQQQYQPRPMLWVFRKELRIFLRDSTEWSQLFLIGALIVVYLYNFKALPLERAPMPLDYLSNIIAYANIGLTGFLVASLAARFVFPSVGAEGMAFGLVLTGPIRLGRYLFYKYLFYVLPFTLLALILLVVSNHLLQIKGPMHWISLITGMLITWSVVAMALGFGAMYANFKEDNRAATLGGIGAILFLFCSLCFELVCIVLGSVPAYRLIRTWLRSGFVDAGDLLVPALTLLTMTGGALVVSIWCLKKGKKRVREIFT